MDSSDTTRAAPQPSRFYEAVFANTAADAGDTLLVFIPSISLDLPFGDPDGVIWSPVGGALPQAGDRALVAESNDGSWWVVSWWADTQSTGVSEARVAALEAGPEAITAVSTFTNSWANFDAASNERPAGFYRHNGRVYLTGVIKNGTVGSTAFTLPPGYRPRPSTQPLIYSVTSNGAFGALFVYPNGGVLPAVGASAYFSLDGISFRHA